MKTAIELIAALHLANRLHGDWLPPRKPSLSLTNRPHGLINDTMYTITITRTDERTVTRKGAYTVTSEVPWTPEKLSKETMYEDAADFLKRNPTRKVYDYAPDVQTVEKVETQVLRQEVSELDVAEVIKAVNGL